jgi:ankyrin repeat protein
MIREGHASVDVQDSEGRTPLNYAVLNYSSNCIKAILDCDDSAITIRDSKGRTALHYACAEGNMDCICSLALCPSCEVNCGDNRGTTALHWAAAGNQPETIRFLLSRQADKTKRDSNGMTALDHARTCNHTNCIEVLEHYSPVESSSLSSLSQSVKPVHHQSTTPSGSSKKTKLKFPFRSQFSVSSSQASTSGSMTDQALDGDGSHGDQRKGKGLKETVPGEMLSGNSCSINTTTTEQKPKPKTRVRI